MFREVLIPTPNVVSQGIVRRVKFRHSFVPRFVGREKFSRTCLEFCLFMLGKIIRFDIFLILIIHKHLHSFFYFR